MWIPVTIEAFVTLVHVDTCRRYRLSLHSLVWSPVVVTGFRYTRSCGHHSWCTCIVSVPFMNQFQQVLAVVLATCENHKMSEMNYRSLNEQTAGFLAAKPICFAVINRSQ